MTALFAFLHFTYKKALCFIAALSIFSSVFATTASSSLSLGLRESTTTDTPYTFALLFSVDDFSSRLRIQEREVDASLSYAFKAGNTMSHSLIAHTNYVLLEGGWSDFSYLFSQNFLLWNTLKLSYGLGVQFGLAYSPYSDLIIYSLTPLVNASIGFDLSVFDFDLYMMFSHPEEREWKAVPTFGAVGEFKITENQRLSLDCHLKLAEYLMVPRMMVTAAAITLTYTYRSVI